MIRVNTFNTPLFLNMFPLNSSDIKSLTLNCFFCIFYGINAKYLPHKTTPNCNGFQAQTTVCVYLCESLLDNSWSVSWSHHTKTGDYYNQDLTMLKWGGFLSSLPYKTLSSILNLKRFSLAKSTNPVDPNSSSHCLFFNIWQETPPHHTYPAHLAYVLDTYRQHVRFSSL